MEREHVRQFLRNLTLALHDQALEDEGMVLQFYWDTSDVRDAVLGQSAYYDIEKNGPRTVEAFNSGRFHGDRALVQCLESSGWFGTIRMLQPHQSELYKLLNRDFGVGPVGSPQGGPAVFVAHVGLNGLDSVTLEELANLPPERIERLVQMQAGQAATLFKVVQCVRYNWPERLARWLRDSIFTIEVEQHDYSSVVGTELFNRLLAAFDHERPIKSEANNFADAVALCQLSQKLNDFKAKKSLSAPRFFSSVLYNRIVKEHGLHSHFTYEYDGQEFPVFRGIEYYKLRATLRPQTPEQKKDATNEALLQGARQHLDEIGKARDRGADVLKITLNGEKLEDILTRLTNYSFLEQVWLRFAATTEVKAAVEAVRQQMEIARDFERSGKVSRQIEQQLKHAVTQLGEASSRFREFADLRTAFQIAVDKLSQQITKGYVAYRNGGVLRFGFPSEARPATEGLLEKLVSDDGTLSKTTVVELVKLFRASGTGEPDIGQISMLGGVLWTLKMDFQLIELLTSLPEPKHRSLKTVLAAACFRMSETGEGGRELLGKQMLDDLKETYNRTDTNSEEKFYLAIGLGYLCHRYLRCLQRGDFRLSQRDEANFLREAIEYARIAADFPSPDHERKVYALNQYLYYQCLYQKLGVKPQLDWEMIGNVADRLLQSKNSRDWQYRYDDTLAYYYEAQAEREKNPSRRKDWFNLAHASVKRAVEDSREDVEVMEHMERLMVTRQTTRSTVRKVTH
ncbi:MAG TPA: hypothetical protein VMU45_01500 [Candidatus Eisenbacteria bacterium]|nr:hypothetical protein [Candidatus Eisenbacteria bacterium]